jgi:virginiamycin B lyase
VTEFSQGITPNSGPLGITKGPDGNLWFAESNTGKIGRITPHGVVTEFQVALPGQGPRWITAGPDGNIWFTESNAIGRITTSGTDESVFAAGFDPGAAPWQITSAPDGNLWFTDSTDTAARIGRITPRGVVTEFTQGISSNAVRDHLPRKRALVHRERTKCRPHRTRGVL